jgi:hypothetical protein
MKQWGYKEGISAGNISNPEKASEMETRMKEKVARTSGTVLLNVRWIPVAVFFYQWLPEPFTNHV